MLTPASGRFSAFSKYLRKQSSFIAELDLLLEALIIRKGMTSILIFFYTLIQIAAAGLDVRARLFLSRRETVRFLWLMQDNVREDSLNV
jgi:hypothetical protein